MIIRDAIETDNLKMLAIQKSASQIGEFEITIIKKDFKSKSNFYRDGFFLVAEDEKTADIIGFLGIGIDEFKVKDKVYKGAYLYDLRTNPKYRGKVARWLKGVAEETNRRLKQLGIDFYFASIKADNLPSMKLLKHFNMMPAYGYITYALPVFNKKIVKKVKIEDSFKVKELEYFYSESNQEFDFLPVNLNHNFLYIFHEEKRLIRLRYQSAQIIGWDTKDIADIGLVNVTTKYKMILNTLYATSKIIPFVNAPVLNKTMKTFRILKYEYKREKDFRILLNALNGYCYQNHFYLILFFLPKNQSFNKKILGKLTFKTDLVVAASPVTDVDFSDLKNLIVLPRI